MDLSDDELLVLDGRCRAETQRHVDEAKRRQSIARQLTGLTPEQARFCAEVARVAEESGALSVDGRSLYSCPLCGKHAGYAKHKRSGRRGGMLGRYVKKGEENREKPLTLWAMEFSAPRLVRITIKGYSSLAACGECLAVIKAPLVALLASVQAEIPESFTGAPPAWKRWERMRCECGWDGHEGEMGALRTLFGDGFYPGKCPACGLENAPLGRSHISRTGEYVVTPARGKGE
jgi:hypothetical protein